MSPGFSLIGAHSYTDEKSDPPHGGGVSRAGVATLSIARAAIVSLKALQRGTVNLAPLQGIARACR
jgi:hypothetical protein